MRQQTSAGNNRVIPRRRRLVAATVLALTTAVGRAALEPRVNETRSPLDAEDGGSAAVFLILDEDTLDNGIRYAGHPGTAPLPGRQNIVPSSNRLFTQLDVNDTRASTTMRQVLKYFHDNPAKTIAVMTGDVGGEGWLAPNCIPTKWISGTAGTCTAADSPAAAQGLARFLNGLVQQTRLSGIPDVRPLRALGLETLEGQTVCAVVYDGDVSINYSSTVPYQIGSLQGATLGIVAFTVLEDGVNRMQGFSSGTLPEAQIRIENAQQVCGGPLRVYSEAPIPRSSSTPGDTDPHAAADDSAYVQLAPPPPPTNRAPVITSSPITGATLLEPYAYRVTATDADGGPLTYSLTTVPTGMTIDPSTGNIDWLPPGTGNLDVAVRVTDSQGVAATQSFAVTVGRAANRPPQLIPIADRSVPIGSAFRIRLVADDPDPGDVLSYGLIASPAGAALTNGVVEWTAAAVGAVTFTVDVRDTGGLIDTETFTVQVVGANLPPTIEAQADATVTPGASFARQVTAVDPNGDALTYALLSGPTGLSLGAGGQIDWTPTGAQLGSHAVKFKVSDTGGLVDAALFSVRVEPPSTPLLPPVAKDDRYAVRRGSTLNIPASGVLLNDESPGGLALGAALGTGPTKGTLNLSPSGSFTYTPTMPPPGSTEPRLAFELRRPTLDVTGVDNGPYVADLNRDGRPEILTHASGPFTFRRLDSVHGDGSVRFSLNAYQTTATPAIALRDEFALGDLDGDGFVEIVAINEAYQQQPARQRLIALNHDGTHRWTSEDVEDGVQVISSGGFFMPTIADIDGDGRAEILVSHRAAGPAPLNTTQDYLTAYDSTGRILWHCRGGTDTSNAAEVIAADLDLDGRLELLFANDACDSNGQLLWSINVPSGSSIRDMAVANLDDDPFGEVVYLRGTEVRVYEHTGVIRGAPVTLAGSGVLSRPVVADVNGDGRPEILVARDDHIVILNRDLSLHRLIDVPGTWGGTPTVFDLNGDGKPEIIHHSAHGPFDASTGDPQFGALMIFDGSSGTLLHAMAADRHSADELLGPIVADVDGDGSAAIVTRSWLEDFVTVRVFKAATGKWAASRPVWNQYAYNVTNVNADGSIPRVPIANWLTPGLNNFNVNEPLPSERTSAADSFTYTASNGSLSSNVASVALDILPPNTAPQILSTPPPAATPGVEYLYAVRAVDPDIGETLVFTLAQAPADMTINASTGLIRWTPQALGQTSAVVRVVDSQGESAMQQMLIEVGEPVTVPAVVGLDLAAAQSALDAAGLISGTPTQSPSSSVPIGQVISQEPAALASVAKGAAVALVVSSGVPPVVMPNVVGKRVTAARGQLTALGLTASVTRVFSASVPRGEVLQQAPAAGTLVAPGVVTLTESAGSGLAIRLQRTVTPADQSIPFTLVASDLNGSESPAQGLNVVVTAIQTPAIGALPTVAGNTITPAADTRGSFRITATDPATGRSASAEFGVTYARAGADSMMDTFVQMTEAMADIDGLIRQGATALEANDTALMRTLLDQMVQRWRQVDLRLLSFATPLAPERGFVPSPSELASFGLAPTPDDLLADRVLKDSAADLQAWIDGLRTPSTTMAQLEALADRFGTRAARLNDLRMSEWGVINSHAAMTVILTDRIPQLYDALMDEIGQVVANNTVPEPEEVSGPFAATPSTLSEVVTNLAMRIIVEKMQEHLSATYVSAKKYATNVLFQAAWGAGAIAVSQHVKAWVYGQDITAVVSGASMSFRVFESANSMIEGPFDPIAKNNQVVMIGPQLVAPVRPFVEKIKELMQYGKDLDENLGYKSYGEIFDDLKGLINEVRDRAADIGTAVRNALQQPEQTLRGCLFSSSSTCNALLYPDGFKTVYEYTPPPPFGCQGFTGLPVPVIVMVFNKTTSTMYFGAPPFLPSPAPDSGCQK